ncbi:MAG: serine/threonine protein kinase [Deltaproteobacteria bacterium]|nr:serine/threonine protein kinase [Deltaproteobacteria bacterium]
MARNDYVGQIVDDKYKVVRLLGRGGNSAVFLARHVVSDEPVAIKFLHSQYAEKENLLKLFYHEAQMASQLRHPNIISLYDVGVSVSGEPYLAMEYLEGETLSSFLSRSGPVSLSVTCAIIEPVLQALEVAHGKDIVHRYLKPENIFLVNQANTPPLIKLADFGISKLTNPEQVDLTRYGVKLDKPEYLSPELIQGKQNVDRRADIYSVGILMYKMLTGKIPFQGNKYHEILIASTSYPPLPPIEINPAFPQEAEMLIMRCLEKLPENRPDDVRDVLHQIRAFSGFENRVERLQAALANLSMDMGTMIGKGSTVVGELSDELLNAAAIAAARRNNEIPPKKISQKNPSPSARKAQKTPSRSPSGSSSTPRRSGSGSARRSPATGQRQTPQRLKDEPFWKQKRFLVIAAAAVGATLLIGIVVFAITRGHGEMSEDNEGKTPNATVGVDALDGTQTGGFGSAQPAGTNTIQVEVRGAPDGAKILYDGIPVPLNPFRVETRDSIVPMTVEAPGFRPFVTSVVPSEDQVVVVSMTPLNSPIEIPQNELPPRKDESAQGEGTYISPSRNVQSPASEAASVRVKPQSKVKPVNAQKKKQKNNAPTKEGSSQTDGKLIEIHDIFE